MAKVDYILGTAGHIDHGKSSLIKALTGTDPDRLTEEKERGITITLGFAQLTLPSGRKLGVVDVPGHERFVRQMVAGATGMDVGLLVIAADDGIMPQTTEHLAVLQLLGVTNVVIALTKTDLVDEEWAAFMAAEVEQALASTPFASAPIIPCSSTTGNGLPELLAALDNAVKGAERTKPAGAVRYPIDRVFTVKGFGTVATGTLWSGTVHVGDEVELLPQGTLTRIRSIQVHGQDKDAAAPGNRVALCLNGLSTADVHAGDFLATPGTLQATDRFDAELTYLDPFGSSKPLESGIRVHIAHGTREVAGRVLCMNGAPQIEPGTTMQAQIRLDDPLPLSYQDRFIVRSLSPARVIGGGCVLAAHPRRRTNLTASEESMLNALSSGDTVGAIDALALALDKPVTAAELTGLLGLDDRAVERRIAQLEDARKLCRLGSKAQIIATTGLRDKLMSSIESTLLRFHSSNPQATGLAKEELRHMMDAGLSPAVFGALLEEAEARGIAIHANGEVSHPKAGAGAQLQVEKAVQTLWQLFQTCGDNPPLLNPLVEQSGLAPAVARKGLAQLAEEGKVVRISPDLYLTCATVNRYRSAIATFISENGPATAAQLKEACNTSRKYAMPLLEYLDDAGFTKRAGDLRTLA